jgi:hypothetical protein
VIFLNRCNWRAGQYIYTSSLVVNLKKVLVEPRHRLEDNIKMDLKEPG